MKKIFILLFAVLMLFGTVSYAALTNPASSIPWWSQQTYSDSTGNKLKKWVVEVDGILTGLSLDGTAFDYNSPGAGQYAIGSTGYEYLIFDFVTANTIGLYSNTGATTIDANGIALADIGGLSFTNGQDINDNVTNQIFFRGTTGGEDIGLNFETANTIGIVTTTGVTAIDFNNIALNDANFATTASFDASVIDANTAGQTDPNAWIASIGHSADANSIRYYLPIKYKGTTYYVPAFTGSPTQ